MSNHTEAVEDYGLSDEQMAAFKNEYASDEPFPNMPAPEHAPVGRQAIIVNAADITAKQIVYLWKGKFPRGRCSVIGGIGGVGKSFLMAFLVSRISTGGLMPDGATCDRGHVIIVAYEDDPADVWIGRLNAHKADLTRIHFIKGVKRVDPETGEQIESGFTLEDKPVLERAIDDIEQSTGEKVLAVIIDPIGSGIGGKTDSNTDNAVRAVLGPIAMLAEKCGAAFILVAHHRKTIGTCADDLILGSRAFSAFARAVWHIFQDVGDPDKRLFLPGKNNLSRRSHGLAFTISGDPAAIKWTGEVDQTADQYLAELAKPGPEPEAQRDAAEFLKEELKDGAIESSELRKRATAAGHAWRTLERARQMAKVIVQKNQFSKKWEWRLPKSAGEGEGL